MITEKEIKTQLRKVNNLSIKLIHEDQKFVYMCREYYGEITYNEMDKDQIIDCLDYGHGKISFKEFNEIMKKINLQKEE
jgi:hypothetical protein